MTSTYYELINSAAAQLLTQYWN